MTDQQRANGDARDIRKADRGQAFEQFSKSDFFREEFAPLIERHFCAWLDAVMAKKAAPETLQVLQQLMADLDERIKLGKAAAERLARRRFPQRVA